MASVEDETAVEDVSASQKRGPGVLQGLSVLRGPRGLLGDKENLAFRGPRATKVTKDAVVMSAKKEMWE